MRKIAFCQNLIKKIAYLTKLGLTYMDIDDTQRWFRYSHNYRRYSQIT